MRTPDQIVAASEDPTAALLAFVGQELEHWGFGVTAVGSLLAVQAGDVHCTLLGLESNRTDPSLV